MLALEVVFWAACALIVWTQVGYPLALAARRARDARPRSVAAAGACCRACR